MLFGDESDLADLKKSSVDLEMRVIPVTRDDFKWLTNSRFISFLRASFGIKRSQEGFLRVSKQYSAEDLQKSVVMLSQALDTIEQTCVAEDGTLDEDGLNNFCAENDGQEEREKKSKKKKRKE